MYKSLLSILLSLILIGNVFADRRNYIWTYQYMTMPKGMTELEFYQTTKLSDSNNWEYRIEIEQGITDRFDFAVYQIFNQNEDDSFRWDAVQMRARYRIGEVGKYFIDPLFYIEYRRKLDFGEPNKAEAKLILAKQIDTINIAINPVYELFFAPGVEHEVGLDVGFSYEVNPQFVIGAETTSRMEFEDSETEIGSYLGPTISIASGRWWYTFGIGFGITEESDNARVRIIMGIHL